MDATQIQDWMQIAMTIVGVLSTIAAFTPTPVDNAVLVAARKVLNLLAMNWGQSENRWKPGDPEVKARKRNRKPPGK